jgi:amino acid transporter
VFFIILIAVWLVVYFYADIDDSSRTMVIISGSMTILIVLTCGANGLVTRSDEKEAEKKFKRLVQA